MDILQNKNLGANSSQIKAKAWEEIAIEFNCRCPNHYRDAKTLSRKYIGIKFLLKKEITAQRRLEQTNSNAGSNANEWRPKTAALCELAAILCPTNCGSSSICNDRDAEEWSQTCDSSGLNN